MRWFHACLESALGLVAPHRCAACDAPLGGDDLFCAACEDASLAAPRVELRRNGQDALVLVAAGAYHGPFGAAVRRLKYEGRTDLARPIARRLARALAASPLVDAALVPVPLHRRRLAERGYNQSALVAAEAARVLGWTAEPRALSRRRATVEQAGLARRDRLENVAGAFAARAPLPGRRVIVVDDVVTTFATALACVHALAAAGAQVVGVAAVARAADEDGAGGSGAAHRT